ncbi:MAG: type I DNA topoisomerase, partial [Elusimicrobiota bacterium]|nr:type I DNA topoisomerase [Elusimicrobiota bacterium]
RSSYGHVRDLPEKYLGVNIKQNFKPTYVTLPKAKKFIPSITKLLPQMKNIYLATDYDREGEAIAWHLTELLKLDNSKVKRITFHEITPEAIKEALKNPRGIDFALVDAQQARRILDRLVGYKLSPLLWRKIARRLSAGRVQSVAVRMIVEREAEIKNFKPEQYYTIEVDLAKNSQRFTAELTKIDNKKVEEQITYNLFAEKYKVTCSSIRSEEDAEKIKAKLKKLVYEVSKIEKKKVNRSPLPPFTTSTLQQDGVRKLGYSSQKTMYIAQTLYEGVDLPEGTVGLITYMRTDSVTIAKTAQEEARKYITEKIGKDYLPEKPRTYKTKTKGAQEAHECIRPTSVYREPNSIKEYLTTEQSKLYQLIWQRFVASQMSNAIYDTIKAEISAGAYKFSAIGRTLLFKGFLKIYQEDTEVNQQQTTLPELIVGEKLSLMDVRDIVHFTSPPERYNEASIIKTLEKHGIGRPSTYAPIIATILNRKYVILKDRKFYSTEVGTTVTELLKKYFPEIVDTNFTAELERKLDKIASRNIQWEKVISEFYEPFSKKLDIAQEQIAEKQKPVLTEKICPVCGSQMYLRESKYGKFYSCSKWPGCKGKLTFFLNGKKQGTNTKCGSSKEKPMQ